MTLPKYLVAPGRGIVDIRHLAHYGRVQCDHCQKAVLEEEFTFCTECEQHCCIYCLEEMHCCMPNFTWGQFALAPTILTPDAHQLAAWLVTEALAWLQSATPLQLALGVWVVTWGMAGLIFVGVRRCK